MIDPGEFERWIEEKVRANPALDIEELDSDTLRKLLQDKVAANLSGFIGTCLHSVYYHRFDFEIDPGKTIDVTEPFFYTDGEVELRFEMQRSVFLIWCSAPRPNKDNTAYIICALSENGLEEGNLTPFTVSETPLWRHLVGTVLEGVDFLGLGQLPCVLRLRFGGGDIFVGSAYYGRIGAFFADGDGVLVCTPEEWRVREQAMANELKWEIIWSLPEPESNKGSVHR